MGSAYGQFDVATETLSELFRVANDGDSSKGGAKGSIAVSFPAEIVDGRCQVYGRTEYMIEVVRLMV